MASFSRVTSPQTGRPFRVIRVGLTGAPMTSDLPPSTEIARSARDDLLAFDLFGFSLAEQPTFGPFCAARFRSTNRRRNGFRREAPAALEDAVLESSHAGVYTLQIHAFPTRRAAGTFGRQQFRQSISTHGHSPSELSLPPSELSCVKNIKKTMLASVRYPTGAPIQDYPLTRAKSGRRARIEPCPLSGCQLRPPTSACTN